MESPPYDTATQYIGWEPEAPEPEWILLGIFDTEDAPHGQKIAGHTSETMTKNNQKDQAEIVWSEAIPDLNISEITG